nr:hypothetical protein [Tanacetum cinerariifolium]
LPGSWWLLGIDGEGRGSGVEVVEWSVEWGKWCCDAPWCLFVVGLSGGGSGIGVRVEEWQENGEKWGRNGWREKWLVVPVLNRGRDDGTVTGLVMVLVRYNFQSLAEKVRILQVSQENSQKSDKNGHENGKSTQEPGIIKLSQPKSTWSTLVNPQDDKIRKIPKTTLIVKTIFTKNPKWITPGGVSAVAVAVVARGGGGTVVKRASEGEWCG